MNQIGEQQQWHQKKNKYLYTSVLIEHSNHIFVPWISKRYLVIKQF